MFEKRYQFAKFELKYSTNVKTKIMPAFRLSLEINYPMFIEYTHVFIKGYMSYELGKTNIHHLFN